jgi:IMP dehydrogenase/GMP reductase
MARATSSNVKIGGQGRSFRVEQSEVALAERVTPEIRTHELSSRVPHSSSARRIAEERNAVSRQRVDVANGR